MYADRVACCPLMSHADTPSALIKVRGKRWVRQSDRRTPDRYIALAARRGPLSVHFSFGFVCRIKFAWRAVVCWSRFAAKHTNQDDDGFASITCWSRLESSSSTASVSERQEVG